MTRRAFLPGGAANSFSCNLQGSSWMDMNFSRRRLLERGARLMAAAAAGQSGLKLLGQQPQNAKPGVNPDAVPGMVYKAPAAPTQPSGPVRPWLHPERLARFVDPLPIPQALPAGELRPHPKQAGAQVRYHRITMRQVETRVHRDLPPTSVWS